MDSFWVPCWHWVSCPYIVLNRKVTILFSCTNRFYHADVLSVSSNSIFAWRAFVSSKDRCFHVRLHWLSEAVTVYWYQGFLRTHRSFIPESVRILIEAASQARTVSFTDCIRFCALPTSISVASRSSSEPGENVKLNYSMSRANPCVTVSKAFQLMRLFQRIYRNGVNHAFLTP